MKNVGWSTGNYCNARCKHCYSAAVREAKAILTQSEIDHIVDQLTNLKVETVNLGGNEPIFTNGPDARKSQLPYIVESLHDARIAVGITTNGTTLLYLERYHSSIFELVNDWDLSLDSPFELEHNENRRLRCFDLVLQAAHLCKEYDITKSIAYCANSWNSSERHLDSLLGLSLDLDAEIRVNTLKPVSKAHFSMLLSAKDYFRIFDYLLQRTEQLLIRDPVLAGLTGQNIKGCPCGTSSFRIHSKTNDGKVPISPCVYLHNFAAGDLLADEAQCILKSRPFQEMQNRNETIPKACHEFNCRQLSICRGGCVAMAYLVGGSLENIDPYCPEFAKATGVIVPEFPRCRAEHTGLRVHENYLCTWIGKARNRPADGV